MKQASGESSGTTGGASGSGRDPLVVLREIDRRLAELAADLVPERVPGHRIPEITRALTGIERKVRGARLVLRKAAADTGEWKAKGHTSAADQVAKEEGISHGQAAREIEASGRLADMPQARDAVGRGEISPESAAVVAEGTAADPSAESGLVRSARRGDLRATRRRAQEAIARADERSGERARRVYERRSLRTWVTVDGEGHGHWTIPAEMHARVVAALKPYREAAFRAARAAGEHLTDEQLMADALDMLMRDVLLDDATDASAAPSDAAPDGDGAPPGPGDPDADLDGGAGPSGGPGAPGAPDLDRAGPSPSGAVDPDVADGAGSSPSPAADGPMGRTRGPDERGCPRLFEDEGSGESSEASPSTPPVPTAGRPVSHPSGGDPAPPDPPRQPRVVPTMGPRPSSPAPRNRRPPAQVHVLVDFDALQRGYATSGETCEIHGIGPIPVALAAHLLQDSILRLVVTGTDITKVTSQRRYVPEAVRRALFARDKGRCVACGSDRYLELHHHGTDFAAGGPTEYSNLAHVCSREHALITHCGWSLHRTDTGWEMRPPGGTDRAKGPP